MSQIHAWPSFWFSVSFLIKGLDTQHKHIVGWRAIYIQAFTIEDKIPVKTFLCLKYLMLKISKYNIVHSPSLTLTQRTEHVGTVL